jgi:pimeloyl-ACP methyl ester carboxylesterase
MRRLLPSTIALALVLAACSSDDEASNTTDPTTPTTIEEPAVTSEPTAPAATSPDTTEPAPTGTTDATGGELGTIEWGPCDTPGPFECGTLEVPLDHADPDGTQITIALSRLPATGAAEERIGSLVVNPGGPGGSGVEAIVTLAATIPAEVTEVFDLVGFDPRGVGESSAVTCDLVRDDGVELVPAGDRATWEAQLGRVLDQLETCTAEPAELLSAVGTNNAARDLDLIRAAVGDEQLTFLGFSYGSRLGATYAELFPDRVRALVLDGALKPSTDLAAIFDEQVGGFDRAFGNFADACDADPDCILREIGPTRDVVTALRAELVETGSFATDDPARELTPGEFDLGIIAALYSKEAWPFLAQALYLAETNADGTLLQVLGDSYSGRQPDGTYSNQTEANAFVNCADDPARPSVEEMWARSDALGERSEFFGDRLRATTGCIGHPDPVDPLVLGPAEGAPPILVIGTTGDPATPYEWAIELADFLVSGVLYTVEAEGHTAYTRAACANDVVNAYLIDLELPAPGSSCSDNATADFFPPAGSTAPEQVVAFVDCLREQGLDIEAVTVADVLADPTGESLFAAIDPTDPAVAAAIPACQSLLPG